MPSKRKNASPVYPQTKVSQEDWLNLARDTLNSEGVEHVRILSLAQKLGVSRSSFYWYFKGRQDILDKLLAFWRGKNTQGIVDQALKPSDTIVRGILNLFECWTNDDLFDPRLDFAIREWSRRSAEVKKILHRSDDERVDAICKLFRRHGYEETDAFIRARVVYFMQVGYYAIEIVEPLEKRLSYLAAYIRSFTGQDASETDLERFRRVASRPRLRQRPNPRANLHGARQIEELGPPPRR
jgi:AcrR family transcriptional regulator